MLIVVHFSHLLYLDLNPELRQFERQYRNISVRFAIDLSVTCQCRSTLTITFMHNSVTGSNPRQPNLAKGYQPVHASLLYKLLCCTLFRHYSRYLQQNLQVFLLFFCSKTIFLPLPALH